MSTRITVNSKIAVDIIEIIDAVLREDLTFLMSVL